MVPVVSVQTVEQELRVHALQGHLVQMLGLPRLLRKSPWTQPIQTKRVGDASGLLLNRKMLTISSVLKEPLDVVKHDDRLLAVDAPETSVVYIRRTDALGMCV